MAANQRIDSIKQTSAVEGDKRMNANQQTITDAGSLRRMAMITGVLWVITFITSIPPRFTFYAPVRFDANYVVGPGADTLVAVGALLEMILIIANIGTAVLPFPIFKRQNEGLALGFVTARVVESTFIGIGLLSMLAIVMLRQGFAGTGGGDAASFLAVGRSLLAVYETAFLLGPGFVVGVGNGLILGYLMYRSGLVPRGMAMLGLIGGPLIIASGSAVMLGVIQPGSLPQAIATIPEFFWELSLGIYLIVKGFRPSAITSESGIAEMNELSRAA